MELVGLADRREDRVETYSSGMQQRLHLARALLHDPELIYLDEPTVGIDPVGARELRKTVKELVERGKTILLTTHYMAEAEELCDRIAIINQGRIVALDTPASLKKQIHGDSLVEIEVRASDLVLFQEKLQGIKKHTFDVADNDGNKKLSVRTTHPEEVMKVMAPFITSQQILNLEVRNQTLEDVYVSIIQGEYGMIQRALRLIRQQTKVQFQVRLFNLYSVGLVFHPAGHFQPGWHAALACCRQ